MNIKRLTPSDRDTARTLFRVMALVFDEGYEELSDAYLDRLLGREDFWALGAFIDNAIVGGLTAHTLPMTRVAASELFIFDLAVQSEHQRKGIGRGLVAQLRALAAQKGIGVVFVPADNDDDHALDFYRAIGGVAAAVTIFTFTQEQEDGPAAAHA